MIKDVEEEDEERIDESNDDEEDNESGNEMVDKNVDDNEREYINIFVKEYFENIMKKVRITQVANKYRVQLRRTVLCHQTNLRFVIIQKKIIISILTILRHQLILQSRKQQEQHQIKIKK